MIMCSKCHKRMAVVFITKMEDGQRTSEGLCLRCARESGLPVNQALDDITKRMGITPEQLENMEDSVTDALVPSDQDDLEDGGAPAIDIPRLFEDMGLAELAASDQRQVNRPSGERGAGRRQPEDQKSGAKEKKQLKFLPTYCTCLTDAAREGKLDSIVGRERELARVTQILCRRQKNNPCLIGEPGVGKTAIAEALAIRIATGQVPYKLRGKEVWLVDLTALVAGTQFRGQFETRILGLLNEVKSEGNVILVIDEVHNIVGSGQAEGSSNAANILKPALSRGEVQLIGATTLTEYRKYIEKDTALERRLQPVMVEEPSVEESVEMLRGIKHYYEEFHRIRIPDEVMTKRIDRMEVASADIFAYIAEHPEKAAEIRRFMNYYLPTTLKLLNSYDKLSRQRVKGENIQKTMFEIEGMMETIAGAFEKQLDSLFDDDALDIAADISVMESILKQEGLSGEDMKMPGLDPNDTSKTQTK